MTTESIQVEEVYPVPPSRIYEVWLDADAHGRFTGASALIDPVIGGKHTAHDEYIWGTFLELEPQRRIVQAWRTTEFPAEAHDSRVEVLLDAIEGGTRVTIVHSNIPEGQGEKYREGWQQLYLEPLKLFLSPSIKKAGLKKPATKNATQKKKSAPPPKKAAKKKSPAANKKAAKKQARKAKKKSRR